MRRGKVLRLRASTTTAWATQPLPPMRREGLGQTTMVMDRQVVARTIEPSVSRSSTDRGNHTIAGRTAKLVIV